jgi:hypothetical protein
MKLFLTLLVVVVLVVSGIAYYNYRVQNQTLTNGDVFVHPGDKPLDSSVQSEPAQNNAANGQSAAQNASMAVPANDSISRNPPNGLRFAGTGRYQLYRQGDITWRLDTDSGQTCILFATDEQWRKARVYEQGCGNS